MVVKRFAPLIFIVLGLLCLLTLLDKLGIRQERFGDSTGKLQLPG